MALTPLPFLLISTHYNATLDRHKPRGSTNAAHMKGKPRHWTLVVIQATKPDFMEHPTLCQPL